MIALVVTRDPVLQAVGGGVPSGARFENTTQVSILDNAAAESPITVSGGGR